MDLTRREFVRMMGFAGAAGLAFPGFSRPGQAANAGAGPLYHVPEFGNVRLLHIADCHAIFIAHLRIVFTRQRIPAWLANRHQDLTEIDDPDPVIPHATEVENGSGKNIVRINVSNRITAFFTDKNHSDRSGATFGERKDIVGAISQKKRI